MKSREAWGTRFGYVCALLGNVVGCGNVWRFPRVAAANGGGTFIVCYLLAVLAFNIPIIMTEMAIGKKSECTAIEAFPRLFGKKLAWVGVWSTAVTFFIGAYYSVILGYSARYLGLSFTPAFYENIPLEESAANWTGFCAGSIVCVIIAAIMLILNGAVVYRGVQKGIEKISKILLPMIAVLMVVMALRVSALPNADAGLQYLYGIQPEYFLRGSTWLNAFVQALFSSGAGCCIFLTFCSYENKNASIPKDTAILCTGDALSAILVATAVIPAVFTVFPTEEMAFTAMQSDSYALSFTYLFHVFSMMEGGRLWAILFYTVLTGAAFTSMFPMIENTVMNLRVFGIARKPATVAVTGASLIITMLCAWNINGLKNQDWVWSLSLTICCLLIAICVNRYGADKLADVICEGRPMNKLRRYYKICLKIIPFIVIVQIIWWIWQSMQWYPDIWWKPFEIENMGTFIFQAGIMLVVCIGIGRIVVKKISRAEDGTDHL